MSGFRNFTQKVQRHFKEMTKDGQRLFEVDVDKDELWNLYLDSFPAGTNEIFRKRREYDCSCCRSFIKHLGNVVALKGDKYESIWDIETGSETYQPVVDALSAFVKGHAIRDVYLTGDSAIGTDHSNELGDNGKIIVWEHFSVAIPDQCKLGRHETHGDATGRYRDQKNVFKRSLDELSPDAVDTVLELIAQNSLYKGDEWRETLKKFRKYQKEYANVPESDRDNFAWRASIEAGVVVSKIRNHSIGTLLVNLSEGMDLERAVKAYEQIVAPTNYKRPKPVITAKMVERMQKDLTEDGYLESLPRRYARLDDITVNNILFCNRDASKRVKGASDTANDIFASMKADTKGKAKKFSKVEEIGIEKFISDVLPTAKSLELYLENKHRNNFVSLIAPVNADSKTMFKWGNGFSWAYTGNITDSNIRENVKRAGGRVDGILRFSIQWNDLGDYDRNDLDAHAHEPSGAHIAYNTYRKPQKTGTGGQLDVDIISPREGVPAVENITWPDIRKMKDGVYEFYVNVYSYRGGKSGFRAEIEANGEVHQYDYSQDVRHTSNKIHVADVELKDGKFEIRDRLDSTTATRELWGLKTNEFVPVSVVMYSPNYWNDQKGIGHKHVFFMLDKCINSEAPNGIFNEFIKQELVEKHKRAFEVLGSKLAVDDDPDQLSGIGFSTTKRGEVIVKVIGASERILKVKF